MAAVSDAAPRRLQRTDARFANARACAAVVQVPDIADRLHVEHGAQTVVGRRRDDRPFTSGTASVITGEPCP
jgi:hypothetical protein